ncbi:hypothetical protein CLOP_g14053 [Closterium sp. NIES-67]|nr:hypothetical protein CLOP_g14053 [Closterium sp. NIES-67]
MEKKVLTDKRVNDIMKQAVSLTISKPPYINYAPDEAHWLNLFIVWTGKAGPVVALHRHQLTLTMAVIRHKLRNPNMARVQLERSGDPDALGRQERVVQRLLNRFQATKYNGNNYFIGKLYLMDWVDVPENILALDFVGDRGVDDVVEGDLNGEGVEVIF